MRSIDFSEADEGRANAGVHAELVRAGDRATLRITVSAVGSSVEPPAGFAGLMGTNRATAEELDRLASEGTLRGRVLDRDGLEVRGGAVIEGRRARLRERRLRADRRIDFEAESSRALLLELVLETRVDGIEPAESIWEADGAPRLRARTSLEPGAERIIVLEALPSRTITARRDPRPAAQEPARRDPGIGPRTPPSLAVRLGDWGAWDREERWQRLRGLLDDDPDSAPALVAFLDARAEYDLLEWTAVCDPTGRLTPSIVRTLKESGAPHWMRVAVWSLGSAESRTREAAEALLLEDAPGQALGWLTAHPNVIEGPVEIVFGKLLARAPNPLDARELLPPLDVGEFLGALGSAPHAEGSAMRAIDALVARRVPGPEALDALERLLGCVEVRIRQKAILAWAFLVPEVIPEKTLLALVRDPTAPSEIRESAALAYSYGSKVVPALEEMARDSTSPEWRAAISRLADRGTAGSVAVFDALLEGDDLVVADRRFLELELRRLRARIAQ